MITPSFRKVSSPVSMPGLARITIVSVGLSVIACSRITQSGIFFADSNVLPTALFLIAVTFASLFYPWDTARIFLGLYAGLVLFTRTGLLGYGAPSYAGLVIAIGIARSEQAGKTVRNLPGAYLALGFAAVVIFQSLRTTDLRGAIAILCDVIAFALLVRRLPTTSVRFLRTCLEGYVVGVVSTALVMFLTSVDRSGRLGMEFDFNPNDLGFLIGAAVLFCVSGEVFKNTQWLLWSLSPLLLVLLFATGSRTSIYSCAICTVVYLALRKSRKFWVLLICGFISLWYLTYQGVLDADLTTLGGRLATPISMSFEDSGARRAVMWSFLLTQVPNYWKWGVGLRNVENLTEQAGITVADQDVQLGVQPHNIYLTALLEYGVLGLFFLVAWQTKLVVFAMKRRAERSLPLVTTLFVLVQGFFQGQNLHFVCGLLLVAAYAFSYENSDYSSPIRVREAPSPTLP